MKKTFIRPLCIAICVFLLALCLTYPYLRSKSKAVLSAEPTAGDVSTSKVTIVMAGDVLMHKFVSQSGLRSDRSYNFDHLFKNISGIVKEADIAIINQETPIAGEAFGISGYPCFNAPLELADAMAKAGFNVILQATNHTLDKGKRGVIACRKYWRENFPDISVTGTALSKSESESICIVEKNGIRVAVLNYTYGTNGIPLPNDMPYIVSLLSEEKVRRDIKAAKSNADFTVVCPHFGTEYTSVPSDGQKRWCKLFLECGADLVIGTHPHVIQPVEWIVREDGHKMLVCYSLGNFVNSAAVSGRGVCERMLGGMAKITLSKDERGKVSIADAGIIPLVTQLGYGYAGITVYPFSEYTETLAEANRILRSRDPLFSYAYCEKRFSDIFGDYII